jgi:hypothetical protein
VTGSPPDVTLTGSGVGRYWPGQQVRAVASAVDRDTRRELIAGGHDADGLDTTVTVDHVDQARIVSAVWKRSGTALAVSGMVVTGPAPRRPDTIVVVVEDAQRNRVPAELPIAVRSLLVGLDVQGATYTLDTLDAAYTTWPAFTGPSKLFWTGGKGLPTWDGKTARVPAGAIPHLAFVDFPTQSQWVTMLDGVPAERPEVWLTWLQEGDRPGKGYTPDQFQAHHEQLWAWSAGHPNRDRVKLVPDLTWYWERYKNADRYADWIPAYLDYLGVDIYPGGQTGWTSPAECLRAPLAVARTAGVPLVIPEAGVVVPANPTLTQLHARADWWSGLLSTADAAGDVLGLGVWQADGDQAVGTGGFIAGPADPMRVVLTPYLAA